MIDMGMEDYQPSPIYRELQASESLMNVVVYIHYTVSCWRSFRKSCMKPKFKHIIVKHFAVCRAQGGPRVHGEALSSIS